MIFLVVLFVSVLIIIFGYIVLENLEDEEKEEEDLETEDEEKEEEDLETEEEEKVEEDLETEEEEKVEEDLETEEFCINTTELSANLSLNDDEKKYTEQWQAIYDTYLGSSNPLLERILHFGYFSFWINFEGTMKGTYSIIAVKQRMKFLLDWWLSWLGIDVPVILFGVRYSKNIAAQISDLNAFNFIEENVKLLEFEGGDDFVNSPWGEECAYKFKSTWPWGEDFWSYRRLLETINSTCEGVVNHHDIVFSITGGDWVANAGPEYIRVSDAAYSIEKVCIHEFGHSLGLDDLYNNDRYPGDKSNITSIMLSAYNRAIDTIPDMDKAQLLKVFERVCARQ